MTRSLALLAVFALVTVAGCASSQGTDDEVGASTDSALESIADAPAEVPTGAKPKVETVDLSKIDFDLSTLRDARGNLDASKLQIDVLDTGRPDHDYATHTGDLKWVQSDRRELPAFVDTFTSGVDVGGGKCRVKSLSLKKIVVGCKWTW